MRRRSALALLAAGAAATTGTTPAAVAELARRSGAVAGNDRVLVLLELRGGNDGLNTVAPIQDPLYREARRGLALDSGLPLGRGLVLHPALDALRPAWEARRLAFALGVGWPPPNRSHFKATEQWATASPLGEGPGWLAVALDRFGSAGPLVALGPAGSPALEGGRVQSLQMAPALLNARSSLTLDPSMAGDNAHGGVLRALGVALAAFDAGLQALSKRPRVTLLAVSEFGRRLRPNASGGTDHGSASIAFLLGDGVPHPFVGTYPRLDHLDDRGDLIPSMSPPDLYARVLA